MDDITLIQITESGAQRRKTIGKEIEALYTVMEYVLDEFADLNKKRKELREQGKNLTEKELAEYNVYAELVKIYNTYR